MTRMPKAIARRAISVPTRPIPRMPSVLLYSSTPSYRWRSHFPARTLASACGMARAMLTRSEKACSAVEIVFPPGVFITITPHWVAALISTLSTPTPARPTTRSFLAAWRIAAVTLVWLRTTSAENSGIILIRSASDMPVLTTTSSSPPVAISSNPRGETESATRTLRTSIKPARVFRHPADVKKCSPGGTLFKSACLEVPIGHGADVKWSYRVATIAGIQVRIHLTFLLLLAFYAWIYYTDGGPQAAVDGVIFTLLIFL